MRAQTRVSNRPRNESFCGGGFSQCELRTVAAPVRAVLGAGASLLIAAPVWSRLETRATFRRGVSPKGCARPRPDARGATGGQWTCLSVHAAEMRCGAIRVLPLRNRLRAVVAKDPPRFVRNVAALLKFSSFGFPNEIRI